MSYVPKPIETKEDINKQIEIEAANLMYFKYMRKEEAFKEARKYIEQKYTTIVEDLKSKNQYYN